jgi:1-acyl-sn-glycerol-3-phosphate acyltransferase
MRFTPHASLEKIMLGAIMYVLLWTPLQLYRRLFLRMTVEGLENLPPPEQGMVLVINHLNWFDIPVLGLALPLRYRPWWVAKTEVVSNRLIGWWMRTMLVIPIRRGKRDLAALELAEAALRRGGTLIIFPEGHRSDNGELQEGHGGAIRLAARSGCPIVPIAIWGTEVGLKGAIRRKPIHVRIGEPYAVSVSGHRISWHRMNELTEEMMLRLAAMLPEQYWGFYREQMLAMR